MPSPYAGRHDCSLPAPKLVKLSDGGGLQLWVQPTGSRLWRLAYRFEGKQKLLALGSYPLISLAEARQARDDAKRLLLSGINPAQERISRKAGSAKDTFRLIADEYVDKLKKEGRADRTISKVKWLLDFAYPSIGDKCIREIDPASILTGLRRVEVRGRYESARRLRSTIGSVFRYAIATARAETDPTAALRGALISPTVTPRAAITDPKAGGESLLFPSVRSDLRPISDNTLNAALRRMGYGKEEVTAHGFRATASTLLNECGKWHPDAIERQLAHLENNDVRRAYARAEHCDERVKMMQWWADYLDELESKNARVIPMRGRSKSAVHSPSRESTLNPTSTFHQTPRQISSRRKSY